MSFKAGGLHARKFKTSRTIAALVLREMQTTYGRSPGGYIWAVLDPVAAITLLSLIFSVAFRSPALGESFPLFYATGYLPFMIYSDLSAKIGTSLRFSRPLMNYPGVTFLDAILARFFLNGLTHLLVFTIVMSGIFIIFDLDMNLDYVAILYALAVALLLGLGIGTLNCFLMMRFPIWERTWAIINRPMFILSCIFFMFDTIPDPYQSFLWFNPVIHIVGEMRTGFYPLYDGEYISLLYPIGVSACSFLLGLLLLKNQHRALLANM